MDDKIDLLHRQNQTLEQLAETLFRQWFIEEAEEGWERKILDDVVTVKGGSTPSTKLSEFWDGDICWATPKDLSNHSGVFLLNTERRITSRGLERISSGLLPQGIVLLSSRAPIGYLAITDTPLAINQGFIAILCNKGIQNYFVYLWCKLNVEEIKNAGNGSVFQEISKSIFRNLKIQVPPSSLLEKFNEIISPLFDKIKNNQLQIRTLTQLRDTLLPRLMSGEVRVKYR
ncbi:MAG: restriction endonuclease subunit S [Deltaproteobacteria bacterium]|nr:restriction endonuclease subunit S [Deltaproteobacteria bacterium]